VDVVSRISVKDGGTVTDAYCENLLTAFEALCGCRSVEPGPDCRSAVNHGHALRLAETQTRRDVGEELWKMYQAANDSHRSRKRSDKAAPIFHERGVKRYFAERSDRPA
jgi:hypothetical protein